MYIDKITRKTIQNFIFDIAKGKDGKRALSEKSQKNYICFISNVFNYAVDYLNILHSSPCFKIDVKATGKKARAFYTIEEETALL